jgi:uncharacterized protein
MPEYLAPGVYIEEVSTGPRPIEGVSTSTAAIIGPTERGPLAPRMVSSWLEYQRWFGGFLLGDESTFMPYAVRGFFENGGQRLFVARVVGNGAVFAEADADELHIHATGPGSWADGLYYRISRASQAEQNGDSFRLTLIYFSPHNRPPNPDNPVDPIPPNPPPGATRAPVNTTDPNYREPDRIEDYDNLVLATGAANNVVTVVNAASHLVRVWVTPPGTSVDRDTGFLRLGAGTDNGSQIDVSDFDGDMELPVNAAPDDKMFGRGRGLQALEAIDEISLMMAPDENNNSISNSNLITGRVLTQCELLKDRFAIVSASRGANFQNLPLPRPSSYLAFYFPWIQEYDPLLRQNVLIPPSGHVAGIIARTDVERGVHKAPANEVVRGATDLELPVTKAMQDLLNPRGVNCIRDFRADGRGIRLWGARTMSSDPEWKYINVRRLFLFVEESIEEGTQWVVFEPNAEPLWAQVRRSITNFLIRVWHSGALMGLTQEEAFFVKCDRTTMTQDDIDNGRLICYIGIAPVRPAEFVIFRISQKTVEAPA